MATPKKLLLTGATGFLGRRCIEPLLGKGFEIHAVSSKPHPDVETGVEWHQADLLDETQMRNIFSRARPSHLLHLAWHPSARKNRADIDNYYWVQASLTMLRAFKENGGSRVVMAGTCSEYRWNDDLCSERSTPLEPSSFYGKCKDGLRRLAEAYAEEVGLSSAWARVFFAYGPGEHPDKVVATVIRSILRGKPVPCSKGEQKRDYLHVDDIASALVAILDSDTRGAVNIASGHAVSLRELISNAARQLDGIELVRFGEIRAHEEDDIGCVAGDSRRLSEEVGWEPRYDLNSGLGHTIKWWKKQERSPHERI